MENHEVQHIAIVINEKLSYIQATSLYYILSSAIVHILITDMLLKFLQAQMHRHLIRNTTSSSKESPGSVSTVYGNIGSSHPACIIASKGNRNLCDIFRETGSPKGVSFHKDVPRSQICSCLPEDCCLYVY